MELQNNSIKEQVYTIIKETLNIDPAKIDPNMPWYEMGAESFDLVELIVALRDHFRLQIKTKELKRLNTLNDLVVFIEQKTSG